MNETAIPNVTNDLAVVQRPRIVVVCDTQPVTAEGLRTLIAGAEDLRFARSCDALRQAMEWARGTAPEIGVPDVLVLDKAFGIQAILDWLMEWKGSTAFRPEMGVVIWGVSVTEAEALRFFAVGRKGDPPEDGGGGLGAVLFASRRRGPKLDGGLRVPRIEPSGALSTQRTDLARATGARTGGARVQEQRDRE